MSDAAQFDPVAFMANRQKASQPTTKAVNPPGGKDPAAAFDPNKFMADRNYLAPARAEQQSLAPSETVRQTGKILFKDAADFVQNGPRRIMDSLSGHPIDDAMSFLQNMTQARQAHAQRSQEAFAKGDIQTGLTQGFFGYVPFLGPLLGHAADEYEANQKPEAYAHAIEALAPFLHNPAMALTESDAAAALGKAADVTAAGVSGAIGGGLKSILKPARIRGTNVSLPGGQVLSGAALGGAAGAHFGVGEGGAVLGAALPVLRDAFQGARKAIAEKMGAAKVPAAVAEDLAKTGDMPAAAAGAAAEKPAEQPAAPAAPPEAPPPGGVTKDELAQGPLFKAKNYASLNAEQRETVDSMFERINADAVAKQNAPAAPTAQPASQAPPAPSPAPAAEATPQARPTPAEAAPAPTSAGPPVNPAEALFRQMQTSGTIPAEARPGEPFGGTILSPEPFKAVARGRRAANAETLSNALADYGFSFEDLRDIKPADLVPVAERLGLDIPKDPKARMKLIEATLGRLRDREGASPRGR